MKIRDNRHGLRNVEFQDVPNGACFLHNSEVYLKLKSSLEDRNNYVNLDTAVSGLMSYNFAVVLVDAEVVLL